MVGYHETRDSKETGYRWHVWLPVWLGPVVSVVAIVLYILIFDVDLPNIKPRGTLEDAQAAILYMFHVGNILATAVLVFSLLQEMLPLQALWMAWNLLYLIFLVILIIISSFTRNRFIPGRIILHCVCILLSLITFFQVFRIYRGQYSPGSSRGSSRGGGSSWEQERNQRLQGAANNKFNGESNVL